MTSDAAETASAKSDGPKKSGPVRVVVETVVLVVIAIVLAVVVKTFFVQAFYIPSSSMEPGLKINDRILVEKPSYWFSGHPRRGDVVVFADPGGWLNADADTEPVGGIGEVLAKIGLYPTGGHLVKRVVGVAGDTVHCCDNRGRVEVNGQPLDEDSFIAPQQGCDGPMEQSNGNYRGGCRGWTAKVPRGRLFVMGDNRGDSADSSFHLCSPPQRRAARSDPVKAKRCDGAFVPTGLVVGKVVAVVWPLSHFRSLHRPSTFADVPAS